MESHPLGAHWTLWEVRKPFNAATPGTSAVDEGKPQQQPQDHSEFQSQCIELFTFGTVEEFWRLWKQYPQPR